VSQRKPVKKGYKPKQQNLPKTVDIKIYGLIALGVLAVILYYYSKTFDFIQDDSFITFRYVKNFTEGNGLVFNIGERVEGYTCFLWVILLSGVKSLGFNFISASQVLGIISSMFTLLFTYLISTKIFPKDKGAAFNLVFSLAAVTLLAVNGSFAFWAVSGMETGLFGCLITLGIYLYLRELKDNSDSIPLSSLVFFFAALTRPEGNLIFAVTVLHKIIYTLKYKKTDIATPANHLYSKNNLLWLGIFAVPALIFMIWRYSYYGYLMPNTFYAKTGSSLEYYSAGLDYTWTFLKSYGFYGLFVLIALYTLTSKERIFSYLYLVMIFVVFTLYVIFVGGDVLRPNRFFVPILPVFFILVQEGLAMLTGLFDKKREMVIGAIVGIAIVGGFSYYTYNNEAQILKGYADLEKGLVEKMKISANWLKNKQELSGKPLTVAATTIGAISYYSDVILIDMLGLTDKEVAHNPKPIPEISSKNVGWRERNYNVDYVLSRKPDYIYFSTGIKPSAYAERGLFTSDDFMKYYYPYYFSVKELNFTDIMYKRKNEEEAANITALPPNPNYQKSFVNLYNQAMNTQKDKSKTTEALDLYQMAINAGPPGWGTPFQMMGELFLQQNDMVKAVASFKKAVELDDYNLMAHYYLYQYYAGKKDTLNANINLDKIRKFDPEMLTK
jgi:arabinofuranosyltransferase